MRESGVYDFEELLSDVDGSQAFRWSGDQAAQAAAESAEAVANEGPEMVWSCDDDRDDLELTITPEALANLVARARTHCPGCDGQCGRQG